MKSYFSEEFFAGNRARLQKLFAGTAPIVITANGLLQRSGDTTFPFRQDSNFWYLTGVNEPDLLLVLDRGKEYLILPEREAWRDIFDGSVQAKELRARSGIKEVLDNKTGWKRLEARAKKVKHLATLAPIPSYIVHYGLYANPARAALVKKLKAINREVEILDLSPQLIKMRSHKQPAELEALQAAIGITADAFKAAKKKLGRYKFEYEPELAMLADFKKRGVEPAYEPIVAAGANACVIHYVANSARLKSSDLILLDVGAAVEHYAADITRTYSLGKPTRRQQKTYEAVKSTQDYAIGLLKPGVLIKEYEGLVERFMGEKLRELGLIKSISHQNVRKYYPHATSHFLGLDVHDVGNYQEPLAEGMVLTVEPGIYVPKEGIGVRIEDDVLITKGGAKLLSSGLPRTLE